MNGYPAIFDIEMDQGEQLNVAFLFPWVLDPALKAVAAYERSLKEHLNPPTPNVTRFRGGDRPSNPRGRLVVTAEVVFRHAHGSHPGVGHRIARTEAQGLANLSLGVFGPTDKNLTESDKGMGVGKISIQRQRMFTFGDTLSRALRH